RAVARHVDLGEREDVVRDLELLQARDVGLLAPEPLHQVREASADAVDVVGRDLDRCRRHRIPPENAASILGRRRENGAFPGLMLPFSLAWTTWVGPTPTPARSMPRPGSTRCPGTRSRPGSARCLNESRRTWRCTRTPGRPSTPARDRPRAASPS